MTWVRATAAERLFEKVVALARTSPECVREASAALVGESGGVLESWERPALDGYLAFGWLDEWCGRAVDTFARGGGATLPPEERRLLPWMQHAWFSLFEVEHDGGDALVLRDLGTEELVVVRRPPGMAEEKEGNLLLGWAVSFDDCDELTGAVIHVRRAHREAVRLALRHELDCARRLRPHLPTRVLLRHVAPAVHVALRLSLRASRLRPESRPRTPPSVAPALATGSRVSSLQPA